MRRLLRMMFLVAVPISAEVRGGGERDEQRQLQRRQLKRGRTGKLQQHSANEWAWISDLDEYMAFGRQATLPESIPPTVFQEEMTPTVQKRSRKGNASSTSSLSKSKKSKQKASKSRKKKSKKMSHSKSRSKQGKKGMKGKGKGNIFERTSEPTVLELPTAPPTRSPIDSTMNPTLSPTESPMLQEPETPTFVPTSVPLAAPTLKPSSFAPLTFAPFPPLKSRAPVKIPTAAPVDAPVGQPTLTLTFSPIGRPTVFPTTLNPTLEQPTLTLTMSPIDPPTLAPIMMLTPAPTFGLPTGAPLTSPVTTAPIESPTDSPTEMAIDTDAPVTSIPTTAPVQAQQDPLCTELLNTQEIVPDVAVLRWTVNVDTIDSRKSTLRVEYTYASPAWIAVAVAQTADSMIGAEAIIGLPDEPNSATNPGKYSLGARAITGVELMPMAQQTLIDASISQDATGTTVLQYTKILEEDGELPIAADGSVNSFLRAGGIDNTLGVHATRDGLTLALTPDCIDGVLVGKTTEAPTLTPVSAAPVTEPPAAIDTDAPETDAPDTEAPVAALPTSAPIAVATPITAAPTQQTETRVAIVPYYIAYAAPLADREPTDDEYLLISQLTTLYFEEVFAAIYASNAEISFRQVEAQIDSVQFEAGIPEEPFNLYMAFETDVVFGPESVVPTQEELFDIMQEAIGTSYIVNYVWQAPDTPFISTQEALMLAVDEPLNIISAAGRKQTGGDDGGAVTMASLEGRFILPGSKISASIFRADDDT